MKKILVFLLIISRFNSFSQTERLSYYIEKDSLLGVKNESGKIIIPAAYTLVPSLYDGILKEEIKENLIYFFPLQEGPKVYDRNGNFLFEPFMLDSGFDYFSEGYMRFNENKKVGFANQNGVKVIPAQYDWVSPMNFGFAHYCNGCYFDSSQDPEHPILVGGTWGYVDKNGLKIELSNQRNHPKDFETESHQFIPYQFVYNEKEKQILAFFEKQKASIIKIFKMDCTVKDLYFEIVERPSKSEPFYIVKTFETCDQYFNGANETYDDYKIFKVSEDGKSFYVTYLDLVNHKEYSEYAERKIPLDKWIKQHSKKNKQ